MGMMGRLTERDREMLGKAIEGIALNDIGLIRQAVLGWENLKSVRIRENYTKVSKD